MIKLPVGWCGVLTSLEHELHDQRAHDVANPDHLECEGGATGCESSRQEIEARYRVARRLCTAAERRATAAQPRAI